MPRLELAFDGLFNAHHEARVPQGRAWAMQNVRVDRGVLESSARYALFGARTGTSESDTACGFGYGKYSSNEVQRITITGTPTGGTFTITYSGQTTANIAYNAAASAVQTALEGLSNISVGDVKCTGGPFPSSPVDVEFRGDLANTDVALMTTTDSLTGGSSPASAIAERVKGGDTEVYIAAIQKSGESEVTIYTVNASTGVFTEVVDGLATGDWFFQQYGNRIFAANATDGVHYYRIGGGWNDGAGVSRPLAPSFAPTISSFLVGPTIVNFASGFASIAQSGLGGAPTVTGTATGITITNGAVAVTTQTQITITATYSAAQDWQFNDIFASIIRSAGVSDANLSPGSVVLVLENNDGTPVQISEFIGANAGETDTQLTRYSHFANQSRTSRDNVLKIIIKFTVDSWAASKQVTIQFYKGRTWQASLVPFAFQSGTSVPVPDRARMRYLYTYYNATTGAESNPSEELLTPETPPDAFGSHIGLTLTGSTELTTSDRIFVYRQEKASGQWRRLPVDSNNLGTFGVANVTSGTTTYTDKWMEEELSDFPVLSFSAFGASRASLAGIVLGRWKQSLVVGVDRKLWFSFAGFLNSEAPRFAPDPDDKAGVIEFVQTEGENDDRGRTVFLSDERAEDVRAIVGQDSCYGIGTLSSYASVGDSPADSSPPRRLPGGRGAVGKRAACAFGGGAEVGSEDGMWYFSVGRGFSGEDNGALVSREETAEVRRSWITTLLGSSYSGLGLIEHEDALWAFNGTKYLHRGRDGQWDEGTFADSVFAALSVRSRGLKFMDSRGRIHTISTDYTDDNGTSAAWIYETGVLDGPSTKVTDIEIQGKGAPRVEVWVFAQDGPENYSGIGRYHKYLFDTGDIQEPYRRPIRILPGMRYKVKFSGTCGSDEVHSAALEFEQGAKPINA